MDLKIGQNVKIQSYKHDGSLHRTWQNAIILEVSEDRIVLITNKTWVIESDGRKWFTREPAICFFYTQRWFNVIAMMRKTGIYYYCNLASPILYDGEALKNIDYDLDVKVFPDGSIAILDEDEYEAHSNSMAYSSDVLDIIEASMEELLNMIESVSGPFTAKEINHYFDQYLQIHRYVEQEKRSV
jgi:protein associated with RNAse G/E